MTLTLLNWLLAALPILVVLVLVLGFNWGGSRAGAVGWFSALLVALLFFGAGPELIGYAHVKALLLSLDVMYIIWMALLLFHVADEAGALRVIGRSLPRLTADKVMQALLLGWVFASFLQGMGGFGVPVAIVAPLLVEMGFSPVKAVIMASLGHGWAVNFGSLATSFQSLLAVTGLPGEMLAPAAAVVLGIASFGCGLMVAYVGCGWRGLRHSLPAVLALGSVMSVVQYLLATSGLWTLGATGAGIAGLLVCVLLSRTPLYHPAAEADTSVSQEALTAENKEPSLVLALAAYGILIVLTFASNLIPALKQFLGQVKLTLPFPQMETAFGWATPAELGRQINLFGHPGAIIFYSSLIAFALYAALGYYRSGAAARIGGRVSRSAVKSSLGILTMVGVALIMSHSGMTYILADGMSSCFGDRLYPAVAPFIGAIGAFITGSNNNANVLFGVLQMNTAELLGMSTTLILAAQTAGGSLGSIMAPAKVIVGCSTVDLVNREGEVIGKMLVYGLILLLLVSLVTTILVFSGSSL